MKRLVKWRPGFVLLNAGTFLFLEGVLHVVEGGLQFVLDLAEVERRELL
jgi:hypothetical protein